MAISISRLFRMLWAKKYGYVCPLECRYLVRRFLHPRFARNDQNDAEELLQGIITMLQCDLKQDPSSELFDSPAMSPVTAFKEEIWTNPDLQWRESRKRENSFVYRLLSGQFRSLTACECRTRSAYQAEDILRIPIPSLNKVEIKFYDAEAPFPQVCEFEVDQENIRARDLLQRRAGPEAAPHVFLAQEKGGYIRDELVDLETSTAGLLFQMGRACVAEGSNLVAYQVRLQPGEELVRVRVCSQHTDEDGTYFSATDPMLVSLNVAEDSTSVLFDKIRRFLVRYIAPKHQQDVESATDVFRMPASEDAESPGTPSVTVADKTLFRLVFDDNESLEEMKNAFLLEEIFYNTDDVVEFGTRAVKRVCCIITPSRYNDFYQNRWFRSTSGRQYIGGKTQFTLKNLVRNYLEFEHVGGVCDHCEKQRTKKLDIWRLPPVVIIAFKRFEADESHMSFKKIRTFVSFPLTGLTFDDLTFSRHVDSRPYDLIAAINHAGEMETGHYSTLVKFPIAGGEEHVWRLMNDENVLVRSESEVVSENAYVLVYQRRDLTEEPEKDGE